jgi:hypothetical protein
VGVIPGDEAGSAFSTCRHRSVQFFLPGADGPVVSVNSYAAPRRRVSVAAILGVLGVVLLAAVGYATVGSIVRGDDSPVLPDTFDGRARIPSDQDFGQAKDWRETADAAAGGAGIAGAAYGTRGQGRIHVTAARADLAGKLDLSLVADEGRAYGEVRCSRNVTIVSPAKQAGVLLCWHTSKDRSVLAFALSEPPAPEQLATEVDALWQKLG